MDPLYYKRSSHNVSSSSSSSSEDDNNENYSLSASHSSSASSSDEGGGDIFAIAASRVVERTTKVVTDLPPPRKSKAISIAGYVSRRETGGTFWWLYQKHKHVWRHYFATFDGQKGVFVLYLHPGDVASVFQCSLTNTDVKETVLEKSGEHVLEFTTHFYHHDTTTGKVSYNKREIIKCMDREAWLQAFRHFTERVTAKNTLD